MIEALFGYNLKDEPSPDHINPSQIVYLRNYVEFIKDNDNSKLAYINLLPYYDNVSSSKSDYEDYIDDYVNSSNENERPDAFGFDYYISHNIEVSNGILYETNYFYNLDIIREKAYGRPFWAYPDVAQLNRHSQASTDVDQSELRFSVFSPLAYGAKGLIYYTYETREH